MASSDRRGHRADGGDRDAADGGAGAAARRSGRCGGWRGGPSTRPPRAGRRSPTGAGTSSTAARWRRSSTAPTSPSTSPSRSSAAARRPARSTSRARRNVFEVGDQGRRQAARLRLLGRRLRLPPREPAAADRGGAGARQRELLLLGPEGRAGGPARRAAARAAASRPTSSAPASSPARGRRC